MMVVWLRYYHFINNPSSTFNSFITHRYNFLGWDADVRKHRNDRASLKTTSPVTDALFFVECRRESRLHTFLSHEKEVERFFSGVSDILGRNRSIGSHHRRDIDRGCQVWLLGWLLLAMCSFLSAVHHCRRRGEGVSEDRNVCIVSASCRKTNFIVTLVVMNAQEDPVCKRQCVAAIRSSISDLTKMIII